MITPAYAPTATERVLPRLALDFTTGVLDSRVTVTRALNTATRVNSSGYIEAVNANLPRFDYDPVTLVPKGLLIEEARSNICLNSQNLAGGFWTGYDATIGPDQILSPDGTVNAYKIFETATVAQHRLAQTVTTVNATVYTVSMYLKKGSRDIIRVVLNEPSKLFVADLTNGTITSFTTTTATIQNVGNGWFRCTASFTSVGTTTTISSYPIVGGSSSYLGVVTEGWYQYGVQLEAGAFATSYIPTTTTSLTRNADVVTMTGTNFSDWFNASEGALQVNATARNASQYVYGAAIYLDGNNYITLSFGDVNKPRLLVRNAGVFEVNTTASVAQTSPFNQCVAYKSGSISFASNTTLIVNSVNKAIPSGLTTLYIGSNPALGAGGFSNAWITELNYWPQRIINNEVIAFSK